MKIKSQNMHSKASGLTLLAFWLIVGFSGHAQQIQSIKELNSPYDEQHPVFSPTGELFFSVGFHPQNTGGPTDYGDIWMSKKGDDGSWTKPVRVSDLSTSGNDVVVGFTDALTVLVYHSGNGKKQGIHQYGRFGNSWNYIRPLEMGNFRNNSLHFSGRLNSSGDVMVLSMTSFGSYGNEDIYVSFREREGLWTSPLNLGAQINTFAQEQTPYLSDDLVTLYFSSNVQGNNEGKNIYYAVRTGDEWDQWSTPKPLQQTNSAGVELSYLSVPGDGDLAIFTTTQDSEGFGDLMMVDFGDFNTVQDLIAQKPEKPTNEPVEEHKQILEEITTAEPDSTEHEVTFERIMDEEVLIVEKNPDSTEVLHNKNPLSIQVLDRNSLVQIPYNITVGNDRGDKMKVASQSEMLQVLDEISWSKILISSRGYIPQDLSLEDWKSLEGQKLLMVPAKAGTSVVLENIQFNRGTADFADVRSIQIMDNLVEFLKENEDIIIRLEGHTDNAGDPSLNKELSLNRASKIRGYLTLHGVNFERIRISGWGGTKPIADNQTEEGRVLNRRVEMLIER